jgi:hypothetical protein
MPLGSQWQACRQRTLQRWARVSARCWIGGGGSAPCAASCPSSSGSALLCQIPSSHLIGIHPEPVSRLSCPAASTAENAERDARSIFVGNVDFATSVEEVGEAALHKLFLACRTHAKKGGFDIFFPNSNARCSLISPHATLLTRAAAASFAGAGDFCRLWRDQRHHHSRGQVFRAGQGVCLPRVCRQVIGGCGPGEE